MNRPFHQGSYQERYVQMGDEAEGHFEKNNCSWVRYGLNRPDFYDTNFRIIFDTPPTICRPIPHGSLRLWVWVGLR